MVGNRELAVWVWRGSLLWAVWSVIVFGVVMAASAYGHHSIAGRYDFNNSVCEAFAGRLSVNLRNPHIRLSLDTYAGLVGFHAASASELVRRYGDSGLRKAIAGKAAIVYGMRPISGRGDYYAMSVVVNGVRYRLYDDRLRGECSNIPKHDKSRSSE